MPSHGDVAILADNNRAASMETGCGAGHRQGCQADPTESRLGCPPQRSLRSWTVKAPGAISRLRSLPVTGARLVWIEIHNG